MITTTGLRTELRDGATLRFCLILSEWKIAKQKMLTQVYIIIMLFVPNGKTTKLYISVDLRR